MATKQPQPVLTAASIAASVHSFAVALGFLGLATWQTDLNGEAEAIGTVVVFVLTVGAHFLPALAVRAKVTPVAKPQDNAGNALAPVMPSIALSDVAASPIAILDDDEPTVEPEPDNDDDEPEVVAPEDEPHLVSKLAGDGPQHAAPLVTGTAAPVQTPTATRPTQGDFVPPAAG